MEAVGSIHQDCTDASAGHEHTASAETGDDAHDRRDTITDGTRSDRKELAHCILARDDDTIVGQGGRSSLHRIPLESPRSCLRRT